MSRVRLRVPSPALVVSVVALIVALGGTSYAAFSLPNGSVGTKQLKNKAVTNAKLASNSVGTAKIQNGAVTNAKLASNSVGTANIQDGAVTNAKLASNSVGTANIQNGAVTASKINTSGLTVPNDQTASNFTQGSPNQPITATTATIGSIQITTTGSKRVIASAAVHAVNGVAATGVYLVCRITIDGNSGVNDTDYASPAGGFTIVDASVSPLASAVVGAGTHTVTLLCSAAGGGAPQATVVDDALATWAVSQ